MSNTPQQVINTGEAINDGTGESLRASFTAINNNFANIWAAGPVDSQVVITNNKISTDQTNLDLILAGNGVGNVRMASTTLPTIGGVYDLGSATEPFSEIHGQYFYGNGRFLTGISGGSGGSGNVTFGLTPPLDPNVGDIWIQSSTAVQYIYFSDGTGNQWAEMEAYQTFNGGDTNVDFTAVASNIIPAADNTYTLGNATNQWASLYVSNSTIYIGGVPLSVNSGNLLTVDGSPVVTVTGNTSNIGNFVFNQNALENLNGLSVDNGDLAHGWTARLALPANGMTNPALFENTYGNISIGVGASASITSSWIFGSDGNLTLPSGTPSINYSNGQPYISGGGNGTPGGSNTQVQFNDSNNFGGSANLTYDKVTKTLTTDNITVANLYFSGTGAVNIESGNDLNLVSVGPLSINVGGSETWTFDNNGALVVPGISTGSGQGEIVDIQGSRTKVGITNDANYGYAATFSGTTPALAYTASSNLVQSAKVTFVVQSNNATFGWEQFDVSVIILYSGGIGVTVSNRMNNNPANGDTQVTASVNGGGQIEIYLAQPGSGTAYVNYTATEFNLMID